MNKRIIFRADGSSSIGMGHIVRCLALADMLKDDFEITFAVQKTDESVVRTINTVTGSVIELPATTDFISDANHFSEFIQEDDIIVLDGYKFNTDYQSLIKKKKCKIVCIDDLRLWHQLADVIINPAEGISKKDYSAEPYSKVFSGLKYALLRKAFLNASALPRSITGVKRVFISMGASDIHNLTLKYSEALLKTGLDEIHLMIGAVNLNSAGIEKLVSANQDKIKTHINISQEELIRLLNHCDVAICPASSIALECCCAGIGLISGFTADNQLGNLNSLDLHHAALNIGDMVKPGIDELKDIFNQYINRPDYFNQMIKNQKKMIDGKSPDRLKKIFRQLADQRLRFRFAEANDVELYFYWANDQLVRLNSFNQNPVIHEDHVKWFQSKLDSGKCSFYLFLNVSDEPVGQVRIDRSESEIVIGISIDDSFRGKSYGVEMLKLATDDYISRYPGSEITAYIKEDNIASYRIFINADFAGESMTDEQGNKIFKLKKK